MISKNTPVLEARDRVLDAGPPSDVAMPPRVAHDSVASKPGRDELRDAAIPAVCEDSTMGAAQPLDTRSSVVNRIVATPRATSARGNDPKVATTHEELCVARPAVVLRSRSTAMIARRDQSAIDDPRRSVIADWLGERCQVRRDRANDPMRRRLRDVEGRRELAHRQVGAQRRTCDHEALPERPRPRAPSPRLGGEPAHELCQFRVGQRGQLEPAVFVVRHEA